ncbi:ParA family protein [Hymenobacter radiodurans]|uniref:ParA family protein n=1 Tax=Hymenobacter radiodurans TaxID=2496028 RepID=UPI0010590027|nr:AAA family ATPase [Hymenobacter radiodurans]
MGHCMAQAGHRVLLVDADSQANLTRCLPAVAPTKNLTQVIDHKATLLDVMQPVGPNLWLVAADESLVVAEKGLGADLAYPLLFKKALKNLAAHIDYVLIDSPPAPIPP